MTGQRTYDILINRQSGTVLNTGPETVEKDLREIFAAAASSIRFIDGKDIKTTVRDWLARNNDPDRGLIIGGGDGTVLSAAEEFLNTGKTLSTLPLGTQNFVARHLGFSPDYKEAAAQYKDAAPSDVDVGNVNGYNFLYGLMIDKNSVDMFESREARRVGDYVTTLSKFFSGLAGALWGNKEKLRLTTEDGTVLQTAARIVGVTNNAFEPRSSRGQGLFMLNEKHLRKLFGNAMAKAARGDGKLAFYAHKGGAVPFARAAQKTVDGTWHQDEALTTVKSARFIIEPAGERKSDDVTIILDGEIQKTTYPLTITMHPKALRMSRYQPGS